MAFKAELCRTWVEERTGGADRYLTHVVTQTRTPQKVGHPGLTSSFAFSGADLIRERAAQLGLAEEDKVGLLQETTFVALSQQRVFYGTRSSFRNRPKDLLHEAPASEFAVHWVDDDIGSGNRFRHLLSDFGQGAWRTDRIGLTALGRDMGASTNIEEFFSVLGDRAQQIPAA